MATDFVVKWELGRGAFGIVYLIEKKDTKEKLALKTLDLSRSRRSDRDSAEKEAVLLRRLDNPYVVSYVNSCLQGDLLCIITEFCEGGNLGSYLKKNRPLPEDLIVCWTAQVTMALEYLHKENVLHRDLKPPNIYLTGDCNICVGDLGLARVLEHPGAMATTYAGTPLYMSPEILQRLPYSSKADIWSLGCVVLEMAAGRVALELSCSLKVPSVPSKYSIPLQSLVTKMMNKKPKNRPDASSLLKTSPIKDYLVTPKPPLEIMKTTRTALRDEDVKVPMEALRIHRRRKQRQEGNVTNRGDAVFMQHMAELEKEQEETRRMQQRLKEEKEELERQKRDAEIEEAARKIRQEEQEKAYVKKMDEMKVLQQRHEEERRIQEEEDDRRRKDFKEQQRRHAKEIEDEQKSLEKKWAEQQAEIKHREAELIKHAEKLQRNEKKMKREKEELELDRKKHEEVHQANRQKDRERIKHLEQELEKLRRKQEAEEAERKRQEDETQRREQEMRQALEKRIREQEDGMQRKKEEWERKRRQEGENLRQINPGSSNPHENPEIRLVLVGKTGAGKSATGNTIIGERKFHVSARGISTNIGCQYEHATRYGKQVILIDTPGIFDTSKPKEEITAEVSKVLILSTPGPHAIILVTSAAWQFTSEEIDCVKRLMDMFGEGLIHHLFLVITRTEHWEDDDTTCESFLSDLPEEAKLILKECIEAKRVVAFQNSLRGKEADPQVRELLTMISDHIKANGGRYYSEKNWEDPERAMQGRIKQIMEAEMEEDRKKTAQLQQETDEKHRKEMNEKLQCMKDHQQKEKEEREQNFREKWEAMQKMEDLIKKKRERPEPPGDTGEKNKTTLESKKAHQPDLSSKTSPSGSIDMETKKSSTHNLQGEAP